MKPDIEDLLKQQKARAPSPDLDRRIDQLLAAEPEPASPAISRIRWLAAAAVLVFGIVILIKSGVLQPDNPAEPAPGQVVQQDPVTEKSSPEIWERTWSDRQLGEAILLEDGTPVHPVIENRVRYTRWVDPETKAVYEQTVPVRELYFVTTQMH